MRPHPMPWRGIEPSGRLPRTHVGESGALIRGLGPCCQAPPAAMSAPYAYPSFSINIELFAFAKPLSIHAKLVNFAIFDLFPICNEGMKLPNLSTESSSSRPKAMGSPSWLSTGGTDRSLANQTAVPWERTANQMPNFRRARRIWHRKGHPSMGSAQGTLCPSQPSVSPHQNVARPGWSGLGCVGLSLPAAAVVIFATLAAGRSCVQTGRRIHKCK